MHPGHSCGGPLRRCRFRCRPDAVRQPPVTYHSRTPTYAARLPTSGATVAVRCGCILAQHAGAGRFSGVGMWRCQDGCRLGWWLMVGWDGDGLTVGQTAHGPSCLSSWRAT